MILVLAFVFLATSVSAKTYERCELAKELKYAYEVPDSEVGIWVCIAEHESQYNTSAIGMLSGDGSGDHGIFQINDEFWCSPPGKGWACGLSCAELEDDDIEDDFICARRIYKEHKILSGDGFNAWAVYQPHCKGERAKKYVEGCFNGTDDVPHPKKKVPTKKVYPWLVPKSSSTTPSPDKNNEDQSRNMIGGINLIEVKQSEAVSSQFTIVTPPGSVTVKDTSPANSISTSSVPPFNSLAAVSQPVKNQPSLSRLSNSIPPMDGHSSSSSSLSGIRFTSLLVKNPTQASSQFPSSEATLGKFDSSSSQFNSRTSTSESILNHLLGISRSSSNLPPSTATLPTKSIVVTTTTFPGISKPTLLVPSRSVIGSNNRFTSPPEKISFTVPIETTTSSHGFLPRHNPNEPRFIVNGMAWV